MFNLYPLLSVQPGCKFNLSMIKSGTTKKSNVEDIIINILSGQIILIIFFKIIYFFNNNINGIDNVHHIVINDLGN